MIVEPALGDLVRRPDDGAHAARVDEAEGMVHFGGDALDQGERMDDRERHPLTADAEIAARALGLRPPITIRRHLDWAEAVGLDACLRHAECPSWRRHRPAWRDPAAPVEWHGGA